MCVPFEVSQNFIFMAIKKNSVSSERTFSGFYKMCHLFSDEWVNEIWDSQFTECRDVDLEASPNVLLKALTDVSNQGYVVLRYYCSLIWDVWLLGISYSIVATAIASTTKRFESWQFIIFISTFNIFLWIFLCWWYEDKRKIRNRSEKYEFIIGTIFCFLAISVHNNLTNSSEGIVVSLQINKARQLLCNIWDKIWIP